MARVAAARSARRTNAGGTKRLPHVATAFMLGAVLLVLALCAHRWFVRREAMARFRAAAASAHSKEDDEGIREALAGLRLIDLEAALEASLAYGFDGDSDTSRLAGSIIVEAAGRSSSQRAFLERADGDLPNVRARIWTVIALGGIAPSNDAALDRLHLALDDPDRNIVLTAIKQIRTAANERSLPVLRRRLARCTLRDQVYWNLDEAVREIEGKVSLPNGEEDGGQ